MIDLSEEIVIEITVRNLKKEIKVEAMIKIKRRRREKIAMIAIDHHLLIKHSPISIIYN